MTRFFVKHPVTTWMIFTAFVVLGMYALPRLQIEAIPEVDLPSLSINTRWSGASPQAVQRSITLPIEEASRKVHGVESVKSTSRAGNSVIEVEFRRDVDVEFARLELNEQLGQIRRTLPPTAGQPEILPYVPEEFQTDDFFSVDLASHVPTNELRELSETWIVPRLLSVAGVADARVLGGADPVVRIVLDRTRLRLHGIEAGEVFGMLFTLDDLDGAGVVWQDGEEHLVAVRSPVDLDRLRKTVVARRGDRSYTLEMLGEVRPDFEDPDYFVRSNGRNVVSVQIEKRSGANSVSVSRSVREALPIIAGAVPFDVEFDVDRDEGHDLEQKLVELVFRSSIILAMLFLVLVISLRQVRLTAIVTGSILLAIVISLSLFYFMRLSVNFITISGLTVCFGLILDNSILVLDSIHRRVDAIERANAEGFTRAERIRVAGRIIIDGTGEVLFPILATTLTTIVAFLSFIFLSGRLALYYVPLAVSVATAMAASVFVAFAWIPVVLDRGWARSVVGKASGERTFASKAEIDAFVEEKPDFDSRAPFSERVFVWFQRLWWVALPATAALLIWSWGIYDQKVIKGGFFSFPDTEELFMYLEMPSGTDVVVTSETVEGFEADLLPVPEGVKLSSRTFGNQALVRVEFDEIALYTEHPLRLRQLLVEHADQTGGAAIFIRGFSDQPYIKGAFRGGGMNSLLEMTGYNSGTLRGIAEDALAQVERQRRVRNARITTGGPFERSFLEETVIRLDRAKLGTYGLTVTDLAARIRRILGVDIPWSMIIEGTQEQVQLSFDDADDIEYMDVAATTIETPSGEVVQLGDLVTIETLPLSGPITRENQRYTMNLNWEYVGTDRMRRGYLKSVLDGIDLPYGYEAKEGERVFFTAEEEEELGTTILLAVVFIFIILAALFESLSLPVLVLSSVPLALVGVVIIFWKMKAEFDSSAQIGLVLLFGVVVNNAILLVSRFREESAQALRRRVGSAGLPRAPGGSDLRLLPSADRARVLMRAVARGTRIRLRSILLTSGTTIVGLAPLVLDYEKWLEKLGPVYGWIKPILPDTASDSENIWDNLALSSIGGLIASTVLLIVVMPCLYTFSVRLGWILERNFRGVARSVGRVAFAVQSAVLAALYFKGWNPRTFVPDAESWPEWVPEWTTTVLSHDFALGLTMLLLGIALTCLTISLARSGNLALRALLILPAGVVALAVVTAGLALFAHAAPVIPERLGVLGLPAAILAGLGVLHAIGALGILIPRISVYGATLLAGVLLAEIVRTAAQLSGPGAVAAVSAVLLVGLVYSSRRSRGTLDFVVASEPGSSLPAET